MKHKVKLENLEVVVESKNNKLVNIKGDTAIKTVIKKYFEKPVKIIIAGPKEVEGIAVDSTVASELKPGEDGYISAVLVNILRNKLEYNIIPIIEEERSE